MRRAPSAAERLEQLRSEATPSSGVLGGAAAAVAAGAKRVQHSFTRGWEYRVCLQPLPLNCPIRCCKHVQQASSAACWRDSCLRAGGMSHQLPLLQGRLCISTAGCSCSPLDTHASHPDQHEQQLVTCLLLLEAGRTTRGLRSCRWRMCPSSGAGSPAGTTHPVHRPPRHRCRAPQHSWVEECPKMFHQYDLWADALHTMFNQGYPAQPAEWAVKHARSGTAVTPAQCVTLMETL